jgi:hypothetical protein
MEGILSGRLGDIFVGAYTCGLESFARQLLVFTRDEMTTEREVVDGRPLAAQIKDFNLNGRREYNLSGTMAGEAGG